VEVGRRGAPSVAFRVERVFGDAGADGVTLACSISGSVGVRPAPRGDHEWCSLRAAAGRRRARHRPHPRARDAHGVLGDVARVPSSNANECQLRRVAGGSRAGCSCRAHCWRPDIRSPWSPQDRVDDLRRIGATAFWDTGCSSRVDRESGPFLLMAVELIAAMLTAGVDAARARRDADGVQRSSQPVRESCPELSRALRSSVLSAQAPRRTKWRTVHRASHGAVQGAGESTGRARPDGPVPAWHRGASEPTVRRVIASTALSGLQRPRTD